MLAFSRLTISFFILSTALFSSSPFPHGRDTRNSLPNLSDLPEPYNSLEEVLPLDAHGWFSDVNKRLLKHIIHCNNSKVVVELGSWLGASTIAIATWAGEGSTVYAVDHFEGDGAILNTPEYAAKIPTLYEQFLSNVIHYKLWDRIIPVKMSTLEAADELDFPIDLVYVDAAHDYESVYNDIMAWYPKLKPGGVMCGDDWGWPSVQQAVTQAAEELGRNFHYESTFWWFQ